MNFLEHSGYTKLFSKKILETYKFLKMIGTVLSKLSKRKQKLRKRRYQKYPNSLKRRKRENEIQCFADDLM